MEDINIINVKNCSDCPFKHTEYDDYAIGDSFTEICTLASNLNLNDYFIDSYSNDKNGSKKKNIPDWCPIKNKPTLVKLK